MKIEQDVLERLLVAKGLLGPIRFAPTGSPDPILLARQILAAHDAAELAIAAVARYVGKLPGSPSAKTYLMDYFAPIEEMHPGKDVPGKGFFAQLNSVRASLKHNGIFPNPKQWFRVGERTYEYVSTWCADYLGLPLDDLDESSLIADSEVKKHHGAAVEALRSGQFKLCLAELALATHTLFRINQGLRRLDVGRSRAEDAIKLAPFGVHGNDYLALQEFLPSVREDATGTPLIVWDQGRYGHPGNWTEHNASFCLRTFVEIAIRIQNVPWIPGAIEFAFLYEHKVTALVDDVQIVQEPGTGIFEPGNKVVVRTLSKGETLRAHVSKKTVSLFEATSGRPRAPILSIVILDDKLFGEVEADKVKVTCIPHDHPWVRDNFPKLPEIDYDPTTA